MLVSSRFYGNMGPLCSSQRCWTSRSTFSQLNILPAFLPQASPASSNELPSCQHLRLQQWDVCERTLGPACPAWVQAAGDSQSQQTSVCAVEPQQPVSAKGTGSVWVCVLRAGSRWKEEVNFNLRAGGYCSAQQSKSKTTKDSARTDRVKQNRR